MDKILGFVPFGFVVESGINQKGFSRVVIDDVGIFLKGVADEILDIHTFEYIFSKVRVFCLRRLYAGVKCLRDERFNKGVLCVVFKKSSLRWVRFPFRLLPRPWFLKIWITRIIFKVFTIRISDFILPRPCILKVSGNTPIAKPYGRFLHLRAELSEFSDKAWWLDKGDTVRGKSQDLTEDALQALGETLDNVRKNSGTTIIRFCYDPCITDIATPRQIKASFYGIWSSWHRFFPNTWT